MQTFLIVLEFFFIILLQFIGIGFHVMEKVLIYDKRFPEFTARQIFKVFLDEDWSSLLISSLVLFIDVLAHAIIHIWMPHITTMTFWILPYVIWTFIIALVLGYGGQAIAYKFLGRAVDRLNNIADRINEQKPV